jgi:hypothetical protein
MNMDSLREMGRLLVAIGILLVAAGTLLSVGGKLPFRLGRLPGDIHYSGRHGSFYFPIVTSIVLSLLLTAILWILNSFRR